MKIYFIAFVSYTLLLMRTILPFTVIPDAYLLRESSFPFVSGDSFRAIAHHIHDNVRQMNPYLVRYKDIIFVKTDKLDDFFSNIHPLIPNKYILITHNADDPAPGRFEHFLNDEKILIWFGQSPSIANDKKFVSIPLGIANRYWQHGSLETFTKIINSITIGQERSYLVGINFRPETNPTARAYVIRHFSTEPYCTNLFNEDHAQYLRNMARAKFIISPAGNSLDCHRIWEALYMGAIPIVLSSTLNELLQDLPVVIVNDWSELSEEFLLKKYESYLKNMHTFNYAKLYFPYWFKLIEYYRHILN